MSPGGTSKLTSSVEPLVMLKGPKFKLGTDHSAPFHPSPNESSIVSVQLPELSRGLNEIT